ncbi:hypothetical protein HOC13_00780, partial [Candidatus Woesearchaeota archaeon]|jgi:hypothetical protein|nr:hypothetical protein [Candidatus Woesearchaeota archaeon]
LFIVDQLARELDGQEIHSPLRILFGDEKINIHLNLTNSKELVIGVLNRKIGLYIL